MNFATPLSVLDGFFRDRGLTRLDLAAADYHVPVQGDVDADFLHMRSEGVQLVRLFVDDQAVAADWRSFDQAVEQAYGNGMCLALVPVTTGKLTAANPYSPASVSGQQQYLSELFTRSSLVSGKRLHEYEHVAALEMLFDMDAFDDEQFHLYCGRVVMEVYIDHYFGRRVAKVYSSDREAPSERRLRSMEVGHIRVLDASVFQRRPDPKLKFESLLPGIPASVVVAKIRPSGGQGWAPLAVGDATTCLEFPHRNGGAEGWLSYAAEIPVDLRLTFPAAVKSAKFRPSLRSPVEARVSGNDVELSFPEPRYGALEVNYGVEDAPAYTVYILGDHVAADPAGLPGVKFISPGPHRAAELEPGAAKLSYFLPGLHDFEGNMLRLAANHEYHLSRGAVLRTKVLADGVENVKLTGQGVLDGSLSPRDVGENKGERMGEKWLEDAGYEGYVCFHKCKNMLFDGPVIYNPEFWNFVISGCQDVVVRNHKAVSWLQNNDGIQPRSCVNLLIEHCFLKCNDDCVAIKTRRSFAMKSGHILIRDMVLWNDRNASCLEIGHTSQGDLLEDVVFRDIERIFGGAMAHMCIIDHCRVKNVLFENLYAEGPRHDGEFGFLILPTYYTTDAERGRVQDVTVRNFFSEDGPRCGSHIKGFDADHLVENVHFENINWGGYRSTELSEFLGENVNSKNVTLE